MTLEYDHLEEIGSVASEIINYAGDFKIWIFEGEMGVGKTTLIKAICERISVTDNVSSPTFSLVNVYLDSRNKELYHFDFYRLKDEMEAIDIGCDEYFYSGNLCLIEWPEKIPSLIPPKNLKISIKLVSENQRRILLTKNE